MVLIDEVAGVLFSRVGIVVYPQYTVSQKTDISDHFPGLPVIVVLTQLQYRTLTFDQLYLLLIQVSELQYELYEPLHTAILENSRVR